MVENYKVPTIEGLETLPRHVRDLFYEDPHAQDEQGNTVLHKHVTRDEYYYALTERLIGMVTDLEIKNNDGRTAFILALVSRKKLMIKALMEAGANVHTTDKLTCNAFHYIAAMAISDNLGWMDNPQTRHPLSSLFPLFESLLERGVDVNLKNKHGDTPLMWATTGPNLEIVKFLLKCGANLHLKNAESRTCLHIASTLSTTNEMLWDEPNSDIITELIRNGAMVNCFDNNNRSPLGYILRSEHPNKHYFARKFLTTACVSRWEIRNDFYILHNVILKAFPAYRSWIQHVDACYEEIGRMTNYHVTNGSEIFNLCQFALRGMSEGEEIMEPLARDAVLLILVNETFPIYHDFIFYSFQMDYLRRKLTELDIFTNQTGQKISLDPVVKIHLASFLDIKELFNVFKAFSCGVTLY